MNIRFLHVIHAAALVTAAVAPPALAQTIKPGNTYYTNEQHGFRFKPPADYPGIPLQPGESDTGLVARMSGPTLTVRNGAETHESRCELAVYALTDPVAAETPAPGRTVAPRPRPELAQVLASAYPAFAKTKKPEIDESVKVGKLEARHRIFRTNIGSVGLLLDAWTFGMGHVDVSILYTVPEDKSAKTLDVFARSAKTFQPIERKETTAVATGNSYDDQLARAATEAASTPGGKWRALSTPSRKFIIKSSSDNKKFLDQVILRLEKSRELYERDFPPKQGFDHVSVVRVCGSETEFHAYGNTGSGVAGWFNPGTTELVLYDALNVDRNMTYAVMSHEAFHQYCHFLFDQSEAHRWFDEGHGDYYGGAEFKGNRAVITPHMPGGLDRLSQIREMIQFKSYVPLAEHLNYDHAQWQSQGPSNVSCYAQSWSIVYMLREGALGNIRNRKVWKDEYASIIPNYVETLHAGFQKAYEELRQPIRARAAKENREATAEELEVAHLSDARKQEIWKAAMDASWGKIDVDDFEQRWALYVEKDLK